MKTKKPKDRVRSSSPKKANRLIDIAMEFSVEKYSSKSKREITHKIHMLDKEWDIERWLEMNAAVFAFIGVVLGFFVNVYWLILSAVVLIFLFQHAVQGWCPPVPIFRFLKVRTRNEINQEIYALKILRGDFDSLTPENPHELLQKVKKR